MRARRFPFAIGVLIMAMPMCIFGGSGVVIAPQSAMVLPSGVQSFSALVTGVLGGGIVAWSVSEGSAGGTIDSNGTYTAPSAAGSFHIVATDVQNPSQQATATVSVLSPNFYSVVSPSPTATGVIVNPSAALLQSTAAPNSFFGPSQAGVFQMDSLGNVISLGNVSSLGYGVSSLIQGVDGNLYGTAAAGGSIGVGTVFKVDGAGHITTLHSFSPNEGVSPEAPLIQASDGLFYGTALQGGNSSSCAQPTGCGTVFRVDLSGNLTVLHSFSGPEGAQPAGALIQASDGAFYGTTSAGGDAGLGTVFKMDKTGVVTVLHSFVVASEGTVPLAGLTQGSDGFLYGSASAGGGNGCTVPYLNGGCGGTVFRISTSGSFAVLHTFSGADGNEPVAPLFQSPDGYLYGTTWAGGNFTCGTTYTIDNYPYLRQSGCGTVFRIDAQGDFTVLHAFASTGFGMPAADGAGAAGAVILGKDGNLYGTTFYGGSSGTGTVYRITLAAPTAPFGNLDTPLNGASGIAGALSVTGWAVGYPVVAAVGIWREAVTGEKTCVSQPSGPCLVFIGNATIVPGVRPDVAQAYPGYPNNNAGWGLQVLTAELPNANGQPGLGNGTYQLHAIATNSTGQTTDIGTVDVTVDNAGSVAPFGTIDTPAPGATVSGRAYVNFGWALTPQPDLVPVNGSTIWVFIDNLPVGHPVYNNFRPDIATVFPGLQNSQGAIGYFYIDTTQLENGLHTISWSVKDNAGHATGMGSRYFIVQN